MFYYPTVLHRHTGCFGSIWLAATKGVRISRREFLTVNVGRACEDMMDYILVQPGRPRPRFSLYLSSQLQYGIIIVYHRQCAFFLEEVHQALERLLRCERHVRIDMVEPDRSDLTFPDPLLLLEEAEGALDPFIGVIGIEQALPSPDRLAQASTEPCTGHHLPTLGKFRLRRYERSSSPLCPPVTSHKTTPEQAPRPQPIRNNEYLVQVCWELRGSKNVDCLGFPENRVPRQLHESGLTASEVSALTEVQLEESREERPREERPREERPRGERSWGERSRGEGVRQSLRQMVCDLRNSSQSGGHPEEMVELPEAETKWGEVTAESVLRMAAHHFNHYGQMFFYSLLPPEATRSTAAHIFSRLLELLSMKFSANQTGHMV